MPVPQLQIFVFLTIQLECGVIASVYNCLTVYNTDDNSSVNIKDVTVSESHGATIPL